MELDKKVGVFSDIHLGLEQNSEKWHNIALNFAKWASKKYTERGIKQILIPGDIFHNRNEIGVNTLSVAKQFFDYFKDFKILISTGNHCCFLKHNSSINSISILDGWNNIHIFDKDIADLKYKNKKISMIPWGVEYNDIPESDIVFGHFEISSFYMNSIKVCEHGLQSSDLFKKAPYIISGHFHKRDHRKYDKGQILYLGSPFQHNFGDTLDDRGIYIFDLEENEFEFIENNISPKHYKLSVKKLTDDVISTEELEKIVNNNIVSLVCDCKIDQEKLLSYKDKINHINPQLIRVDYEQVDDGLQLKEETQVNSGSLLTDIETYIEAMDIDCKKEVAEYIKEVYNSLI